MALSNAGWYFCLRGELIVTRKKRRPANATIAARTSLGIMNHASSPAIAQPGDLYKLDLKADDVLAYFPCSIALLPAKRDCR